MRTQAGTQFIRVMTKNGVIAAANINAPEEIVQIVFPDVRKRSE